MPVDDERLAAEVSRLYWESDASVGEIAERLGISRRALYRALQSIPAGALCAECGGALVFTNRSARDAGQAECPACGNVQDVAALREATAEAGAAMRREADRRERGRPRSPGRAPAGAVPPPGWAGEAGAEAPVAAERALRRSRALALGGAALAGVAVGAIAGLLISRR